MADGSVAQLDRATAF